MHNIVLDHVFASDILLHDTVLVKGGSYPSFHSKIVFLDKIFIPEIQYSLKRNLLNQIWKNATGLKDNAEFYILDQDNVREALDEKYRIQIITATIKITFLITTQDKQ